MHSTPAAARRMEDGSTCFQGLVVQCSLLRLVSDPAALVWLLVIGDFPHSSSRLNVENSSTHFSFLIRERVSSFRGCRRALNRQCEPGEFRKLGEVFDDDDGAVVKINGMPSILFYEHLPAGQV